MHALDAPALSAVQILGNYDVTAMCFGIIIFFVLYGDALFMMRMMMRRQRRRYV